MCATRATMSHGSRRRTSRFESFRTIASLAVRPSIEAVDLAAATARGTSDACIIAYLRRTVPGDILLTENGLYISRRGNRSAKMLAIPAGRLEQVLGSKVSHCPLHCP